VTDVQAEGNELATLAKQVRTFDAAVNTSETEVFGRSTPTRFLLRKDVYLLPDLSEL